ncbi:MAG: hypothetical protein US11_C0007G0019 [Candidatus Roizmanbacteria bacterium GW2011_GWA2_36_23]|uniref:DUF5673 domain-containing protein n=1 Tax=Candidatus Roizmanbacteria bacterium GW2011_GWA2_36_23 TaxID=1618480 RepID=A0A0G0HC84_9BACT|nr:MAG: hypothetical protein US11_C0007G0019 [Candidatus Roizmanbacteria bacterium GW2011_GWA2_36_23]
MDNPQVVYAWKAPLRPYKKRSKLIFRFYLALALLLSLIVFFLGDRILLIPVWSLLFLFYTLTITPPPVTEHKINRFGMETLGTTLRWEALSHFYFSKRFGFDTLTVVSRAPFFYHLYLVVPDDQIKKDLIQILSEHLVFQEKPQKTFTDRLVDWLSALVPDEEENEVGFPGVSSKPQPASL